MRAGVLLAVLALGARAQEASSGFELRTSLSGEGIYSHQLSGDGDSPVSGGFRAMFYPVLKLNKHWSVEGAVQIHSQPYFYDELAEYNDRGVRTDVLQAHLNYSRFGRKARSWCGRACFPPHSDLSCCATTMR
jgi:hypothetical protein